MIDRTSSSHFLSSLSSLSARAAAGARTSAAIARASLSLRDMSLSPSSGTRAGRRDGGATDDLHEARLSPPALLHRDHHDPIAGVQVLETDGAAARDDPRLRGEARLDLLGVAAFRLDSDRAARQVQPGELAGDR